MTDDSALRSDTRVSQDPERINEIADSLDEGDQVLINDRTRPLTVKDRLEKPITKVHRRRPGERDYYDIQVLEGNGTEYHLLWNHGSGRSPILRWWSQIKESDGEGFPYEYGTAGNRVERIEVLKQ